MNQKLEHLLDQIYDFGMVYDGENHKHDEKMLNITPDTGRFLSILIQSCDAKRVLEIGTSNGYSTLWLAFAVSQIGGHVVTIEISRRKHEMAIENFKKSGLESHIMPLLQDARTFLDTCKDSSCDFIFLDAERPQYCQYWKKLDRVLKRYGLLVVDNAISPKPEELKEFVELINNTCRYESQVINIGKGELLFLKTMDSKPH